MAAARFEPGDRVVSAPGGKAGTVVKVYTGEWRNHGVRVRWDGPLRFIRGQRKETDVAPMALRLLHRGNKE
jgi:hypothetical protein